MATVVQINGLEEAIKGQRRVREAVRDDIRHVVEQGVQLIQRESTSFLYPGHGLITGNLRRSILYDVEEVNKSVVGTVGPVTHLSGAYSRVIEYGHPHNSFAGYEYMGKGFALAQYKIERLVKQMLLFWEKMF